MAPVEDLLKRYYYYYTCPSGYTLRGTTCYRTSWYTWGRWVVLAVAIGLGLIAFFSCLCLARRRRSRGATPMYGTGWMAPQNQQKWGNQPPNQMNDYNQQGYQAPPPGQPGYGGYPPAPPPPAYGQQQQPQYTGTTFNTNDGYYGTAATGGYQHPVQPPQGTHQPNEAYAPPQGPPPNK